MFEYRDLFRWDRFITPTLIKPFFGVMIGFVVLMGLSGIFTGLTAMAINPFGGYALELEMFYLFGGLAVWWLTSWALCAA